LNKELQQFREKFYRLFPKLTKRKSWFKILCYHRVCNKDIGSFLNKYWGISISPIVFENQLRIISKSHIPVSLVSDYLHLIHLEKEFSDHLAITVDDCYKDSYTVIFPLLKKYKMRATFFPTVANIGSKKVNWQDKLYFLWSKPGNREKIRRISQKIYIKYCDYYNDSNFIDIFKEKLSWKDKQEIMDYLDKELLWEEEDRFANQMYLSWDELREMKNGGIEFGSHGLHHVSFTCMSQEEKYEEISVSKKKLEQNLNTQIDIFCYPYGYYSKEDADILKKAGYKMAVGCYPKPNISNDDLFFLGRFLIFPGATGGHISEDLIDFKRKVF
jgi:peptidoglycan/xylan/chitin deacetylase (PgdA/CDA1 family)